MNFNHQNSYNSQCIYCQHPFHPLYPCQSAFVFCFCPCHLRHPCAIAFCFCVFSCFQRFKLTIKLHLHNIYHFISKNPQSQLLSRTQIFRVPSRLLQRFNPHFPAFSFDDVKSGPVRRDRIAAYDQFSEILLPLRHRRRAAFILPGDPVDYSQFNFILNQRVRIQICHIRIPGVQMILIRVMDRAEKIL